MMVIIKPTSGKASLQGVKNTFLILKLSVNVTTSTHAAFFLSFRCVSAREADGLQINCCVRISAPHLSSLEAVTPAHCAPTPQRFVPPQPHTPSHPLPCVSQAVTASPVSMETSKLCMWKWNEEEKKKELDEWTQRPGRVCTWKVCLGAEFLSVG